MSVSSIQMVFQHLDQLTNDITNLSAKDGVCGVPTFVCPDYKILIVCVSIGYNAFIHTFFFSLTWSNILFSLLIIYRYLKKGFQKANPVSFFSSTKNGVSHFSTVHKILNRGNKMCIENLKSIGNLTPDLV